jgi:hypothetical protein
MLRQNALRLWREELDELLSIDLKRPSQRFYIYNRFLRERPGPDSDLHKSLERVHGDAGILRLGLVVAVADLMHQALSRESKEVRAGWFEHIPWLGRLSALTETEKEATERLELGITAACNLINHLESGAGRDTPRLVGDTAKKDSVATCRNPDNQSFIAYLQRKKNRPKSVAAEARKWYCKELGKKKEDLTPDDKKQIAARTRAGQRYYENL